MKNRFLKISIILVVILTMTMSNFAFVGNYLISYAVDNVATNQRNVEFTAYVKDETTLSLEIAVKEEGYLNGKITMEEGNFTLKESNNEYVNKVEGNTITLNQINSGVTAKIDIAIEPVKEEIYDAGLLNMESKLTLSGIYKDSSEKDKEVNATRTVSYQISENNTEENIENNNEIITNKIVTINNEEKRVIQINMSKGLKENNYPIKKMESNITLPDADGTYPKVKVTTDFNTMTSYDWEQHNNEIEITLSNNPNDENKILWRNEGTENTILTLIYDKDVELKNSEIKIDDKITLYNNKELATSNTVAISDEEKDSMVQVSATNTESVIYKGKLNAGIDRQYQTMTKLKVNLAEAIPNIELVENASQYIVGDTEQEANVIYNKTTIKKEQLDKIFGQDGKITIYNQNGELLETITNATSSDDQGNIIINYEGKEVKGIKIQTSAPIKEGILEFNHIKTIRDSRDIVKEANELKNKITVTNPAKDTETTMKLENTTTKATLEMDKESLSTVISNNVELKAVLVSNNEKYDLYKNPVITIELPEQVENITINSIDLLYENELKIKNYTVEGRTLKIYFEGEQTQYKEEVVEGSTIVINATIDVNKRATTKDETIQMTYSNEKAVMYENGEIGTISKAIKIVAPTDITVIHSIKGLGVETLGQEETKQVLIQRGVEERQLEDQIEIINNNENDMENVKILGEFPTNSDTNNMGIKILKGISVQGVENAKVYYSENTNATDEIDKAENGWTDEITDSSKVSKYLIVVEKLEAQSSLQGIYEYEIPANLDYNQTAKTGYNVKYTNSSTKVENQLSSTVIEIQTGIGPKLETKLVATVGGKESNEPVKNGEVIQYKIEVSNTGTEDISNIKVTGKVPEGTTMVEPEENYEYTGTSYYKELDNKTYESTIDTLKVGEVTTKTYEVRVNKGVEAGTTLSNTAEINYGDVTKQSEEIKKVTAVGNLMVTVKRVTDRRVNLYTGGSVQYYAIIENISNQTQNNVKVQTNLSENLQVERLSLIKGMGIEGTDDINHVGVEEEEIPDDKLVEMQEEDLTGTEENDIESEVIDYQQEINIGTIEPGEAIVLAYDLLIGDMQNGQNPIQFSVKASNGTEEYQSNLWQEQVQKVEVGLNMTSNTETQYIKTGDTLEYTIEVENKTDDDIKGLVIKDNIPTQLTINQVTVDGEVEEIDGNNLEISIELAGNTKSTIKIETVVDYSEEREKAEAITNVAYAESYGETIATTTEITHIIQANDDNSAPGEDGDNNIDNNDIAKGNRTITGVAWYDENGNGQREPGEQLLSNIKVRLLNTETNNLVKEEDGTVLEATTNENGIYVLDKIGNGKYIVIFDYDNTQYSLTKYAVEGVSEEENSNAILNELLIENEKKQVAATDILEISNNNISNINIGLIKLENFDLKLDKYVSKILIQNANGTTVREYDHETMAKVELDAKRINGSTVIIEYAIDVTNAGEVDGYAKKIADYVSTDLKFSSELNKEWYQVGDALYTDSLANDKIVAGETKTVTLTLTKSMTENNTGLIPNTAEIAEDYNEFGITDSNSTPGNRATDENDFGSADVLLSIRTGGVIYITIAVIILVVLGIVVIIFIKKKNKKEGN